MIDLLLHTVQITIPLLVVPFIVLVVALRWGREGFREDYPEDIQALMPAPTRSESVRGWIFGLTFLITLLGAIGFSTWLYLRDADLAGDGPAAAYLVALLGVAAAMVLDLVIIDWLLICAWRPRWVLIPGTEECAGWGDYGFHARVLATPKALVANFVLPAVLAGLAWWLA